VRRIAALLLLAAAGCSGFAEPTQEQRRLLETPSPISGSNDRYRIQMSVDSRWLAGEFDGVVLAMRGTDSPSVRLQLFGDLGPKMLDLMAQSGRIRGYFPQAREGVDCVLPRDATPHPLLFMGASLVEQFSGPRSRIVGVREEPDGHWMRLRPLIPGLHVDAFRDRTGRVTKRRLSWMYGLSWEEEWPTPEELRVSASGVSIRVRILEKTTGVTVSAEARELVLPSDVHVSTGSRP
jgi:hypothetical protein